MVVNVVADGPPGTVPDVQGLSAREAMRKLVKVGLAAHLAGDGFVISQDPPAGAPLEAGTVCRLVLSRWSARPVNLTNSVNPENPGNLVNTANPGRTAQP
jgi:beta-lactam-binding protein with PASTA domain